MIYKNFVISIMLLFNLTVFSFQTEDRAKKIIVFKNQDLRKALETLTSEMGINFIYGDRLIENVVINCEVDKEPEKALDKMLRGTGILYKAFGKKTYVLFKEKKTFPKPPPVKPVIIQKTMPEIDSGYVIQKAILITKEKITYPVEALNNNVEGKVTIKFLIDYHGDVSKVFLKTSSGSNILDSATVGYARKLKFLPAQANGKTINIWMLMSFDYYCIKD